MEGKGLIKDLKMECRYGGINLACSCLLHTRMPRVYRKQHRSRSSGTCAHRDFVHKNHQEIQDIVRGYQLEFGQEFGEDIRPEIPEHVECLFACT